MSKDKDNLIPILPDSWLETVRTGASRTESGLVTWFHYFSPNAPESPAEALASSLHSWQLSRLEESRGEVLRLDGKQGPIWILRPKSDSKSLSHGGLLETSSYAAAREIAGRALSKTESLDPVQIRCQFHDATEEEVRGFLTGLEMAAYRYRGQDIPGSRKKELPALVLEGFDKKGLAILLDEAKATGRGVNLARHLVNLPAGYLNPKTYADAVEHLFKNSKNVTVDVWDKKRVAKEKMGLMLAVGRAARRGPRLVHLRYRPSGHSTPKPIAFVGKGITFDSGGLNLKPSRGMRLMKKDMGGSAALVGLCYWLDQLELPVACDFYLALAENAVSGVSFRPGDILRSRSGLTVEIDNTDAEGRLVLADALDVAVNQKGSDEPATVIDVATLTGAVKVGLGSELAGLFCNDDALARDIERSGYTAGDPCWRMPLYDSYNSQLKSHVADVVNSGGAFGGAITAALFLERFNGGKKWAHLDIYAWRDSAGGAWGEPGGSGQAVQCLAELIRNQPQGGAI